jgi:uncharacterized protein (DUF58 family)
MNVNDLLKKLRKIEIKTRKLSDQVFSGDFHSNFLGRGMSFSEVRAYTYGDDVKDIDWNVTARTGTPHVKIYEEERELSLVLLVDCSASTITGSDDFSKRDMIAELCAVIAFSAQRNGDKAGALLFSEKDEKYISPSKSPKTMMRILREIVIIDPTDKKTNIEFALRRINNVLRQRSVIFIISDFMSTSFSAALQVVSKNHELIGICVEDASEANMPSVGLIAFRDSETGRLGYFDSTDPKSKSAFLQLRNQRHVELKNTFQRAKADLLFLNSKEDYFKKMYGFFKSRRQK